VPTDAGTWAAVIYLALAGSVLAFLVYFSLLKTWSVMSLSFISVFTPVIALLLGFVFLDEPLTAWKVGGAALILVAVALANRNHTLGGASAPPSGAAKAAPYFGITATTRTGAPLPPPIFIGSAISRAPVGGRRSSEATFSSAGMSRS
jgi:hypothetical protein